MIVWICTDMEGLAGIDHWDQCYDPDDHSPKYRYGLEQLTAEVNAAAAGCFDAGATEVRVIDGHGRNQNKGLLKDKLDPRVKKMWIAQATPIRFEGLDEQVTAVAMVGQHAMAGTIGGFLDHTQSPKTLCRFLINGQEHGEMSQFALYAGGFGVPLVYASGDEALCTEAARLFPWVKTTATKRGTGWATCELYPSEQVRANIRRDIAESLKNVDRGRAWRLGAHEKPPRVGAGTIDVEVEWAYSALADGMAKVPGVRRPHARRVAWRISDQRDIYCWPSGEWRPVQG